MKSHEPNLELIQALVAAENANITDFVTDRINALRVQFDWSIEECLAVTRFVSDVEQRSIQADREATDMLLADMAGQMKGQQ